MRGSDPCEIQKLTPLRASDLHNGPLIHRSRASNDCKMTSGLPFLQEVFSDWLSRSKKLKRSQTQIEKSKLWMKELMLFWIGLGLQNSAGPPLVLQWPGFTPPWFTGHLSLVRFWCLFVSKKTSNNAVILKVWWSSLFRLMAEMAIILNKHQNLRRLRYPVN